MTLDMVDKVSLRVDKVLLSDRINTALGRVKVMNRYINDTLKVLFVDIGCTS